MVRAQNPIRKLGDGDYPNIFGQGSLVTGEAGKISLGAAHGASLKIK